MSNSQIPAQRHLFHLKKSAKALELAINTVMIMVVLLVLVIIVLVIVGRTSSNLNIAGSDQINLTGKTTECQLLCYDCCRKDNPIIACSKLKYKSCNCAC